MKWCLISLYLGPPQLLNRTSLPSLARMASIGRSVEGLDLAYLVVGREAGGSRKLLKPTVQLVGNMHGDEAVGRQLVYYFANHLLTNNNRYVVV